ncbi:enoyl-CoA hydratase/isomerase family protein [Sulfitobacter sp. D35]|uniref:enoyl-CoA hydratase/isomerase family protein n=1 Tax=Sulfitobacter sp. D35 TaxID=3083252 RepID=UPI00296FFE63|nr:enoyl-CoA hydratase/isomerase family protein [Sulfitobacter sp. D35]MDW4499205.1 enoyl-CoA hydratase/isomerase family protein [Sulfitobacter sp. D35]
MSDDLVRSVRSQDGVWRMTLDAPRANALTPELLDAIRQALDAVETADPDTLIIAGGKNFCSGGDVARFLEAAEDGKALSYAQTVVPALQDIVLRLVSLPGTVAVAARGAITGGGAGFLFASDCAVVAPNTFLQPYYGRVGFAPDGGWIALLPGRIGAARANAWIATDARYRAGRLEEIGLCNAVASDPEYTVDRLYENICTGTRRAAKALFWTAEKRAALERSLAAETSAFLDRIDTPMVRARMKAFVTRNVALTDV